MRNRLLGVTVAALLILGGIIVAVRTGTPAKTRVLLPPRSVRIDVLPGASVKAVTSGANQIWALEDRKSSAGEGLFVVEIDPRTNRLADKFAVPGPASSISFGANWLWLFGGGAGTGSGKVARVTALDPTTGALVTATVGPAAVSSIAALGPTAYAAVPDADQVLKLTAGSRLTARPIPVAGGPTSVVALRGVVVPSNAAGNLAPILLEPESRAFNLRALNNKLPIVAGAGRTAVWARADAAFEREEVGTNGRLYVVRLRPAQRPLHVVTAPDGSAYVAIPNPTDSKRRASLFYYSRTAIAGGSPLPSGAHSGNEISSLAVDPIGGVVYTDYAGELWRWLPAGVVAQ